MLFQLTLQLVVLDGFRNKNTNSSVPTEMEMKNQLSDVEGFIVPIQSVSVVKQYHELSQSVEKPIIGYRIVADPEKNPRQIISQSIAWLKNFNYFNRSQYIYIDVKKFKADDCKQNQRKLSEMIDELQMYMGDRSHVGVLTKRQQWADAFCSQKIDHVKLGYVNNNGKQNFNDFVHFGGHKTPHLKQFDSVRRGDTKELILQLDYVEQ